MVRPSPVPPYLQVMELSAWVKASKITLSFSLGIPIPVSLTAILSVTLSGPSACTAAVSATSPKVVNLIALPTKFVMT